MKHSKVELEIVDVADGFPDPDIRVIVFEDGFETAVDMLYHCDDGWYTFDVKGEAQIVYPPESNVVYAWAYLPTHPTACFGEDCE